MMKKNILPLILALLMILAGGCASHSEPATPKKWQTAYVAFLSERLASDVGGIFEFCLRDIDGDNRSELITLCSDGDGLSGILTLYTYDESTVCEIGSYDEPKTAAAYRISDNRAFAGLFTLWWGGGVEHYGYLSLREGTLHYELLWEMDRTAEAPRQSALSDNQPLVDASIRLYQTDDNLLEMHLLSETSISELLR